MQQFNDKPNFKLLLHIKPSARASILGSILYPEIAGDIWFYETEYGVLVVCDIEGLPNTNHPCQNQFALHIHEGSSCSGNNIGPFASAGEHYNPNNCPHPQHAGDLPPLINANGNAFSVVLTNKFTVNEIIDKTVIIHLLNDDFKTQPSGNSGAKIACGEIKLYN